MARGRGREREPPLHACTCRGRRKGGEERDSFIYFNARTNICLFNKFFFLLLCYECTYIHIIRCREELVDFLIKHGVLTFTITCDKCGNDININKKTLVFHCNRRYAMKNVYKKRVFMLCWYLVPARWTILAC